jgi:hypothetical protein
VHAKEAKTPGLGPLIGVASVIIPGNSETSVARSCESSASDEESAIGCDRDCDCLVPLQPRAGDERGIGGLRQGEKTQSPNELSSFVSSFLIRSEDSKTVTVTVATVTDTSHVLQVPSPGGSDTQHYSARPTNTHTRPLTSQPFPSPAEITHHTHTREPLGLPDTRHTHTSDPHT